MSEIEENPSEVVLVTGSSGFLGQHIVKLLQERDNHCAKIKLLDIKPYKNNLGHGTEKPMEEHIADITKLDSIKKIFEGVDCVIHAAANCGVGIETLPKDHERVNVIGTSNVIQACLAHGVSRLVATSTVDVNTGSAEIINGTEKNTPVLPNGCIFWSYAYTKYRAEEIVRTANNKTNLQGTKLNTIVLRPTVLYGEEDTCLIYSVLKSGKARKSKVSQIGDGSSRTQMTYAGNAAWAHLVAKEKLRTCANSVSGEIYFITDDTEICNVYQAVKPYAEGIQLTISEKKLPYWLIFGVISIAEIVIGFLNKIRMKPMAAPSSGGITYICTSYSFCRTKANLMLNYKPIFNARESADRSMQYYLHCDYD